MKDDRLTAMNAKPRPADKTILEDSYLAERYSPQPGQSDYLPLSDLLLGLKLYSTPAPIRVLDFGCGGAPYRGLFPHARYVRADLHGVDNIDYEIDENFAIAAGSSEFDYILSTQVLEHVRDPQKYLRECHRLLQPGGRLVLSTHGTFREHACPCDFRRWTTEGLKEELRWAGFETTAAHKLTVGGRALALLLETHGRDLYGSRRSWVGLLLWLLNCSLKHQRKQFHLWCDRCLHNRRVVEASAPKSDLYIGLLVSAQRK